MLGDLDDSGDVGFADFLLLSNNFGESVDAYEDGDINCSGTVDFADFLVLSNNFGQTQNLAPVQSVPEPNFPMGVVGLVLFFFWKRSRRAKTDALVRA